jgi:hypothetical protein
MTTRAALHRLLDELQDPVLAALLAALADDQPATDEERAAVAAALAALQRGDVITDEELARALGLWAGRRRPGPSSGPARRRTTCAGSIGAWHGQCGQPCSASPPPVIATFGSSPAYNRRSPLCVSGSGGCAAASMPRRGP